ncbi:MAG TPA: hypothetical protein VFA26_04400, partial [Gemmataceae bacterium]|nr:hypothetical protein [Gemmataceae bacterium]
QLPLPTEVPPVVSYLLGVTPTGPSSVEEALNALRGQLPSWLGGWRSPAADRDADGLLAYLAAFWELAGPWRKSERGHASPAEGKRLLAYLRRCPSPAFTWALAATVAASGGRTGPKGEVLRTAAEVLADVPGLGYVAEYEYARHLLEQGNRPAARDRFRALHNRVVKAGFALPVDAAFRQAIEGDDKTTWADLVRRAGRDLAARGRRLAVLDLARQCSRFEERPLADELTNLALAGIKDDSERLVASLTAIDALMEAGRLDRADELLQPLLDHPRIGKDAGLWRLGVAVSFRRRQTARGYDRLERALDLEYRCTSGVVNLQTFRQDYTALLGHFEQQAAAYRTLGQEPPADFAGRVVRAADRWRRLESDPSAVCQTASRILRAVGARDLAWDYLTTALASRTGEPTMWQSIGVGLRQEGEPELAARAFRAAFESHPGDGQLLWETAAALDEAGKQPEARELYRQIKEGRGVTATEALRQQAAQRLGEP